MKCVIIAGGKGSRLWPLASASTPKPLIEIEPGKTLLDLTFERLKKISRPKDIYLCIARDLKDAFVKRLPKGFDVRNLIIEPMGRNTAAAAIYAGLILDRADRDCVIGLFPADHHIPKPDALISSLKIAERAAQKEDAFVVLGLKPTDPSTEYGYIVESKPHARIKGARWSPSFVEKPKLARAKTFVASRRAYWNSGVYVFRTSVLLETARRHMPDALARMRAGLSSWKKLHAAYKALPSISIDYAMTQKLERFVVVPTAIAANDVGNHAALSAFWPRDRFGNTTGHLAVSSKNNTVYSPTKPVALLGANDLIVIDTPDALLVASKKDLGRIRELYEQWERRTKIK